jgi:hypothetical protein
MSRIAASSIAAALLLLTGCGSSQGADSALPEAEDSNVNVPEVVQGTAEDVQQSFADSGEFGQEQNVSHPVLVTGVIGAIKTTIDDNRYIVFRVKETPPGPMAMFSKTTPPKPGQLAVGRRIKVLCPSLHLVDDSAVLEDCVLQ